LDRGLIIMTFPYKFSRTYSKVRIARLKMHFLAEDLGQSHALRALLNMARTSYWVGGEKIYIGRGGRN
jgi:hypothetical protein